MKIIELNNITKEYDKKEVISNLNLYIQKGEFLTLLGPSGCGKTTTLRMIAGFENATSGDILMNGKSINEIPPYKRPINTVFQRYALFPHMNVYKNIAFGLKLKRNIEYKEVNGKKKKVKTKLSKDYINNKVINALRIVDMEEYKDRSVDSLSGGQMQRVAIARAIVNEPEILLLDEPLGALDLKMRQEMQLELKEMHRKLGITFVYVTHDQEEALTMSDTIVVMNNGEIMQIGSPESIYNEPVNSFVADFIGESNILEGKILENGKISLAKTEFDCDTKDFEINSPVDIVIRPEDIKVAKLNEGNINGKIISSIFKGMHYEMGIVANDIEFLVQSTKEFKIGEEVSLKLKSNIFHLMHREINNEIVGTILDTENIEIYDTKIPKISKESLIGKKARFTIGLNDIEIIDNPEECELKGHIVESIFKGENYFVEIKLENDEVIFANSPYLWNPNDFIGLKLKNIKLIKTVGV